MPVERRPPQLEALFGLLARHGVRYVVTGSVAALLHGVDLTPGDLDITPALDPANLERLAAALREIEARPDPEGPIGDWTPTAANGWRWVAREARPGERERLAAWRPDPADAATFDHLLASALGALDVVPLITGSYEELAPRAASVEAFGVTVQVAAVEDLLATLTASGRPKNAPHVEALRRLQGGDRRG